VKWNRIYQGDCLQGLAECPEASVDLAFADPPFNIGYEYDSYDDKKEAEHYLDWTRQWGKAIQRVLKPTGAFWLAIGDEYAAELKLIFQNELGFTCRSWVIWYYTFGVHCTRKFSRSHAHLFHFVRDAKSFTFNAEAVKVPSARQLVYADARASAGGRLPDDTWILRPQDIPEAFEANGDTWYFPRVCGTFKERAGWHGCQMPEQLLARIIQVSSNPDDIVVDPFSGSGTTLIVAKKLGRRWFGCELSEAYAAQIESRLKTCRGGDPLEGAPEPRVSAPATANGKVRGKPRKKKVEGKELWDQTGEGVNR
jgi:site-specific DNA-methyltransferase (adenine-specific)